MHNKRPVRVFVRQPFTESGDTEKSIVQGVLDMIATLNTDVMTGLEAQSQDTFRQSFEIDTGMPFTPSNFRTARLSMLAASDVMIVIRTSLSESGAFEAAYNVFGGRKVPMFFAVWKGAPIKTTLLRDLDEFCEAEYWTFENPEELKASLSAFMNRAERSAAKREKTKSKGCAVAGSRKTLPNGTGVSRARSTRIFPHSPNSHEYLSIRP